MTFPLGVLLTELKDRRPTEPWSPSSVGRALGWGWSTTDRYAAEGLPWHVADRAAIVLLGEHPGSVWPDWFDDVVLVECECGELFVPSPGLPGVRSCSRVCAQRRNNRQKVERERARRAGVVA